MDKIDNIDLLDEMYLPDYQYRDDLEFLQEKFNSSAMHGIHNYYKNDELRNLHICKSTYELIPYMKPSIPNSWVKDLFTDKPWLKNRLLELSRVSKYMARAWLAVLIGENKFTLFRELDINDFPFGVCFMGSLALSYYWALLKNIKYTLGTEQEPSIIRCLLMQYARNYRLEQFNRAVNFTLSKGRYAEFWFASEWNRPEFDEWPCNSLGIDRSFMGICKKEEDYIFYFNGKYINIMSPEFIETFSETRNLDALFLYLFEYKTIDKEISDSEFFKELGIEVLEVPEPDWSYYKC